MKKLTAKGLTSAQALGILTTIAMLPMLLYNWRHTSSLFARYIAPPWFAYGVAFGIEVSVFVLALRLGQQRATGTNDKRTIAILAGALFVSAIANILEGYATRYGAPLTVADVRSIDPIQAVGWLAATGLISVLVFALSNIIGGDVRKAAQASERAERRERIVNETAVEVPLTDAQRAALTTNIVSLPPDNERWTCAKCGKSFTRQQQLAAHEWRCKGDKAQGATQ